MAPWKSNLPATGIDSETMAMSFDESNIGKVTSSWQQHKAETRGCSVFFDVVSGTWNFGAWSA